MILSYVNSWQMRFFSVELTILGAQFGTTLVAVLAECPWDGANEQWAGFSATKLLGDRCRFQPTSSTHRNRR